MNNKRARDIQVCIYYMKFHSVRFVHIQIYRILHDDEIKVNRIRRIRILILGQGPNLSSPQKQQPHQQQQITVEFTYQCPKRWLLAYKDTFLPLNEWTTPYVHS